jgi:inhibitor of KinA sporulation pathway (predicted exonuclease)
MMKLKFEGAKHRAGSDTWNTARLLVALIEQYGQDRVLG